MVLLGSYLFEAYLDNLRLLNLLICIEAISETVRAQHVARCLRETLVSVC